VNEYLSKALEMETEALKLTGASGFVQAEVLRADADRLRQAAHDADVREGLLLEKMWAEDRQQVPPPPKT